MGWLAGNGEAAWSVLGAVQHDVNVNYNSFMLNAAQIMLKRIEELLHENR